MSKLFITTALLFFVLSVVISQPYSKGTFSVGVGAEVLFTEASLSKSHTTGLGGTVKGEYAFGKHASGTIASGYYFLKGKETDILKNPSISAIPLKAGLRYYFGSFYGSGEAGAVFFSGFNPGASFAYSFGLGDKFMINRRVYDVSLRHEAWPSQGNSPGVIALRVAYEFAVTQRNTSDRKVF